MKPGRPSVFERVTTPVTQAEAVEMVASARPGEGESTNDVITRRMKEFSDCGRELTPEAKIVLDKYLN